MPVMTTHETVNLLSQSLIFSQVVVEKKLMREQKLTRHDVGRERFVDEVSYTIYSVFCFSSNFAASSFTQLVVQVWHHYHLMLGDLSGSSFMLFHLDYVLIGLEMEG